MPSTQPASACTRTAASPTKYIAKCKSTYPFTSLYFNDADKIYAKRWGKHPKVQPYTLTRMITCMYPGFVALSHTTTWIHPHHPCHPCLIQLNSHLRSCACVTNTLLLGPCMPLPPVRLISLGEPNGRPLNFKRTQKKTHKIIIKMSEPNMWRSKANNAPMSQ